jgi:hypothetical protein
VRAIVAVLVAALELSHPSWSDGSVTQAIATAGAWWIPLHVLLALGYAAIVAVIWPRSAGYTRWLLIGCAVLNTAYLLIDGIVVARLDAASADELWNSPWMAALANALGATWAAVLLSCALAFLPARPGRAVHVGPEAALAMLCIAAAIALRERSNPAAASLL